MSTVLTKEVINKENTHELAVRIKKYFPQFDVNAFDKDVRKNLSKQLLGERINQVTMSLYQSLPKDYQAALKILVHTLPDVLPDDAFDNKLDLSSQNGFIMISLTNYVSRFGLDQYQVSMDALKEMTKRFSAEGAIRYFIEKYPQKTLKTFDKWVKDKSVHVRRLVSEGTRPRLPMTNSLPLFKSDPTPILKYLEVLKDDTQLVVRRSVANNLNDISKDNPDIVIKLLKKWKTDKSAQMQKLIRHALRTLEKQGHPEALNILGYSNDVKIEVSSFKISKNKIKLGDFLDLFLVLNSTSKATQDILVDYVVYHMKANGKTSPKVFKWCKKKIKKDEQLSLSKKHTIKKISTRKYYPGHHEVHIQINGKIMAKKMFKLIIDD